jgi:cell division septation protein DedD
MMGGLGLREPRIAEPEDTEITLGTGKMLALFFGLVALCAVFFGMGYKLGRSSAPPASVATDGSGASSSATRTSAAKPPADGASNSSPDVAFYKSAEQKTAASESGNAGNSAAPSPTQASAGSPPAADPTAAPAAGGYYVQVAAVSKQEDGDALVDALKKKQYPAFSASGADKLFHVQVGPFADIKNAEEMRAKLVSDGYNPILKR